MNAIRPTDTAADALTPREAEFLTLLLQVPPDERLAALSELLAIADAYHPSTPKH